MKVAILLAGHTRTWDKTFPSFFQAFSDINYDVFCHTWSVKGHTDPVWWSQNGDGTTEELSSLDIQNIRQSYRAKKILIENQQRMIAKKEEYQTINGFNAVANMWETVWKANQLRKQYEQESGVHYDCVLKTRYDIHYIEKLDPKVLEEGTQNYKFNFIKTHTSVVENLYSDSIFFSKPEYFDQVIETMRNRVEDFLYASIEKFKVIEGEASFTEFLRKEFGKDEEYNRFIFKCYLMRFGGKLLPLYPG